LEAQDHFNPAVPLLHLSHARAPFAIEVSAAMISRLLDAVKHGEAREIEVGGLLIGSFPKAPTLTLRIEDFVLLERRAADGKQFELSVEQRARLSTMRHRLLEQQRRTLGIFRSHLREGKEKLALSAADRELIAIEFGRAIHAGLLIRAEPPHLGAFFLPGPDGALASAPPLPEFQFNADDLARLAPRGAMLAPVSVPETMDRAPAAQPRFKTWMAGAWLAFALVVCLFLTAWAPVTKRILFAGGLRLGVERRGGMLELEWNRKQPDLARSRSAVLIIEDGDAQNRVVLAPEEIRSGRVAYKPAGQHVKFRLSVMLQDSSELAQTVTASQGR
jgi:hypothetical protein